MDQVRAEAIRKAVQSGAEPASVRVADVEETAIAYMDDNMTRLRIKVVGEIGQLSAPHTAPEAT